MSEDYRERICLCLGGIDPGLKVLNLTDFNVRSVLFLTEGHSVYSADVSADGKSILLGSKTGFVHLLSENFRTSSPDSASNKYFQGAPILSVCFVGHREMTASDTAGNVIVWDIMRRKVLRKLVSPIGPICSLFRPTDDTIAGLSISGHILIWNLRGNEQPRILQASAPPALFGLVRVIFWKETNCWVWPDCMGNLVLFEHESLEIKYITAHKGPVYAISTYNRKLISAGQSDRLIKFWQPDSNEPDKTIRAPFGTISLAIWQNRGHKCLIVDENGNANIYSISDDKLILSETLPGNNYRTVIGPDHDLCQKRLVKMRSERAEQICTQIKSRIKATQFEGLPLMYEELANLGYRHLSLWLQAVEAKKRGEIIKQLNAYRDLMDLIELQNMNLPECLFKYAKVLEKLWQLEEAKSVYQKLIASGFQEPAIQRNFSEVSGLLVTLSKRNYVIEPSLPLSIILEAAQLLHKRPSATYVSRKWPAAICEGPIDPHDFLSKYGLLKQDCPQELPMGRVAQPDWLTDNCRQKPSVIIFEQLGSFLSLAVRFNPDHGHTKLSPVAIASCTYLSESHIELGPGELSAHIESELESSRWLEILRAKIAHVIRQFITRFKSLQKTY